MAVTELIIIELIIILLKYNKIRQNTWLIASRFERFTYFIDHNIAIFPSQYSYTKREKGIFIL